MLGGYRNGMDLSAYSWNHGVGMAYGTKIRLDR